MKNTFFISIIILFFSCKNEQTTKFYPSNLFDSNTQIINLDSTKLNFKDLTLIVGNNQYNNVRTMIEINDQGVTKRIFPFDYGELLFKNRNVLRINSDSILNKEKLSIKDLFPTLTTHLLNNGENPKYSDSPEKAIVEINLDTSRTLKI